VVLRLWGLWRRLLLLQARQPSLPPVEKQPHQLLSVSHRQLFWQLPPPRAVRDGTAHIHSPLCQSSCQKLTTMRPADSDGFIASGRVLTAAAAVAAAAATRQCCRWRQSHLQRHLADGAAVAGALHAIYLSCRLILACLPRLLWPLALALTQSPKLYDIFRKALGNCHISVCVQYMRATLDRPVIKELSKFEPCVCTTVSVCH
jgi:hypothetical protein